MGGVSQVMEGQQFDGNAQNGRGRQGRRQGEEEIGVSSRMISNPNIGPDHVDLAVSEGHHAQRAEDQGESQGQRA